jgi:hypothetical protein
MESRSSNFIPRNVKVVSLYIVSQLPRDQFALKNDIMYLVNRTLDYVPPEDMVSFYRWRLLHEIMIKHIPKVKTEWEKKIIDIYVGKTCIPE